MGASHQLGPKSTIVLTLKLEEGYLKNLMTISNWAFTFMGLANTIWAIMKSSAEFLRFIQS